MKQHIAKLLVFLMLMTTMIVPADLSFAESGNENTTQTEESNDPEKPDSTQETPAKSTDDEKIVENESSPNSSAAKESIIAAENDQLEETVTERMEFLYIESKELAAPGTQNIVVSWKEAIDDIQNMVLVYENEQGKTFTLKESKRNDESIVFTKDFTASEAGTYKIKGVQYFVGNEEKYFAFDDVEIAASFKVVKGQTIEDDAIAKVEVDSNGTVDKKEVNAEIKDAVTSTDAAPKAQTKARRAKSSNIVVVLDPGHGGSDSGARRGSVYEKNINFKVAQYCKAELEQYCGVTVYMTRTGDTNPSLEERAQIAANYGANILVSIHQNSDGKGSAYGAEVYYPNRNYKPAIGDSGKAVADSIQKELVSLGLSNRGTKIRNTANGSTYADGSYSDYYGIIRNSKNLGIPAIIVEHAFLSNASDYNNFLSSDSKLQKLGIADATGIAKAFGLSKGRWETIGGEKFYIYASGEKAYGAKKIGSTWYYFDEKTGAMHTGWRNAGEKKCYYNDKGELQFGAQKIDGKWYYFNDSGYMHTGWRNAGGKKCYYNDKGELQFGAVEIEGQWYYFNDSGYLDAGWFEQNGKRYYIDSTGEKAYGAKKIGNTWYYFDEKTGAMHTGWRNAGEKKCYYNDKGELQFGAVEINGQWYHFDDSGYLKAGWIEKGGKRYYMDASGENVYGAKKIGNTWYYFDEKTGAMHTGWRDAGEKKCYYNDKGELQFGAQKIDGKWYYFNDSGYMHTGWRNAGGKKCYYNDKGELQFGAVEIDGQWYYFNDSGYLVDKHVISGKVATNASQLATFYRSCGGKAFPKYYSNNDKEATNLLSLCQIYVEEAEAENINVDVAFCQAMLETGWLQYRGAVKIESFNFAGIGAVDSNPTGAAKFKSAREGIRAQIQHLKAYANKLPLNNEQVDPRFLLVKRGSAPNVEDLGGKWASDVQYGNKIVKLMEFLWSCQS